MELTPERWRRIETLFDLAADLPADAQAARLADAAPDDPDLRADVLRLLAHDRSRGARVAAVLDGLSRIPATPDTSPALAGRRLGPWRLVREVGRGGMGVVYEAVRDDDAFQKRVAVKVAARAAYAPELRERFAHERQILAQLEHPHIARLIDGGTTDDGVPYFAMEFVEGLPLHAYAAEHRLPLVERLRLFLQVCEAVEYAHQNLVVHRDLKPSNILVANGQVRLLDFGIAKLLAAADGATAGGSHTQTLGGAVPVTPDYCSPEQLRGLAVTTRTDVYSLGLVLYELLTGQRAQDADTTSPLALERSICETPIPAPSATASAASDPTPARQLRGDIDTIVATATQKDPDRRYASVAALADDVRRHLDGRPILARHDSTSYRVGRFARRYWLSLSAAAAVILTLGAGIIATTYQARRAERRFDQVRRIANALMVDVHDAIRDLPASTAAQDVVVRTAVEYLDGLAQEAGDDRSLQLEIADGYLRVARIAYALDRPSLGRPDDARRYYDRAASVLAGLGADATSDPAVATIAVNHDAALGDFLVETGKIDDAQRTFERGLATGEAALQRAPGDPALLKAMAGLLGSLVSRFSASPLGRANTMRYLEVAELLAKSGPETPDALSELGTAYSQAGNTASADGDPDSARLRYRRAVEAHARSVEIAPDNATARRNLMIAWTNVADVALGPLGAGSYIGAGGPAPPLPDADRRDAFEAFRHALDEAEWLRQRDPDNDSVKLDYAVCLGRRAPSFPVGDEGAIVSLSQSLEVLRDLSARHSARVRGFIVEFRGSLAERLRQTGNVDRARAEWAALDAFVRTAVAEEPDNYYVRRLAIPVVENWAMTMAKAGRRAEALALAARVEQLAGEVAAREAQYARAPGWPPRVRAWTAELHELLGDAAAAQKAHAESVQMWRVVAARTDVPSDVVEEAAKAVAAAAAAR